MGDQHVLKELKQLNELKLLVHLHHQPIKADKNIVELATINKVKLVLEHLVQNSVVVSVVVDKWTTTVVLPINNKSKTKEISSKIFVIFIYLFLVTKEKKIFLRLENKNQIVPKREK